MDSKSIWYISKYVAPPSGTSVGGRGYEIMREIAAMGHECLIIASDSSHLAKVPELTRRSLIQDRDGLRVCWLRTMKFREAKSLRRILSWIHFEWALFWLRKRRFTRPDVIIVSSLSLLTIVNGFLLRRRYNARLVFEIRDIWPLTITEVGGFSQRNPLVIALGIIERLGYRYADDIVGTMPNLREHVANVLGCSRPVHCIGQGFSSRAIVTPARLGNYVGSERNQDSFTICYAGTIGIDNALDTLFEAAETLKNDPQIRFLVVGDGSMLSAYKERYSQLPNLTFAPKVLKEDVQAVLATADLLYLSTHKSEVWKYGQSLNKVIDYMLSGKPIVASYSGFSSMIDEADCGTFIPATDVSALVEEFRRFASMSPAVRKEAGERGRTWILENRSYRRLAEDYLVILLPGLKDP
jgi:glycosyltransferase involved in cell wall biosynthesis